MTDPKVALVTTTIHVPHVLELYRACDPEVRFFVAGDKKTPAEAVTFINNIPNTRYIPLEDQQRWACAKHIPENCIQRRNFATLEALEWGADIIVFCDDDNVPLNLGYFDSYVSKFAYPFSGPCVTGYSGWFDPGLLLQPPASHRGFPHDLKPAWGVKAVVGAAVGACAGACLGNPDISAITRIATAPAVHGISELARSGVVVEPLTRAVFNTQNAAVTREFAPAMLLVPQFKRFDDILASLICQRIMREFDAYLHLGEPCVFQERNEHRLLKDLEDEMWGMAHIQGFAQWLDSPIVATKLYNTSHHLGKVRSLYEDLAGNQDIPDGVVELALAWCEDVASVM